MPKHVQLRRVLAELCRTELGPDQAIPSERELMQRYAVSRATVRAAIGALVTEGLLVRSHGKGTFVARSRVQSHLHLASFTQDMRRRGHDPSTRVLHLDQQVPPAGVQDCFGSAAPQWRVERLRLADGEPMAHELGWYSAALAPDLDRHGLTGSIYQVFRDSYGVVVDSAEQTVWAEPADPALLTTLAVPNGAPVLVFDRRSRSGGAPLECVVSRYRADRYQLHMSLDSSMPTDQNAPPDHTTVRKEPS